MTCYSEISGQKTNLPLVQGIIVMRFLAKFFECVYVYVCVGGGVWGGVCEREKEKSERKSKKATAGNFRDRIKVTKEFCL